MPFSAFFLHWLIFSLLITFSSPFIFKVTDFFNSTDLRWPPHINPFTKFPTHLPMGSCALRQLCKSNEIVRGFSSITYSTSNIFPLLTPKRRKHCCWENSSLQYTCISTAVSAKDHTPSDPQAAELRKTVCLANMAVLSSSGCWPFSVWRRDLRHDTTSLISSHLTTLCFLSQTGSDLSLPLTMAALLAKGILWVTTVCK